MRDCLITASSSVPVVLRLVRHPLPLYAAARRRQAFLLQAAMGRVNLRVLQLVLMSKAERVASRPLQNEILYGRVGVYLLLADFRYGCGWRCVEVRAAGQEQSGDSAVSGSHDAIQSSISRLATLSARGSAKP